MNFQKCERVFHKRQEWSCSLPFVFFCWQSFSSAISHLLSFLQSVTLLACSLDAKCYTILLYFSRYCAVRLKMFILCVFAFYYLYEKHYKLITVQYCITISYCSWGPWGKNTGVICHSLLQWTMFCHSFIELCKPLCHKKAVIYVISFLWLWFSFWSLWDCSSCFFSLPSMDEDERLVQASWWEWLAMGKTGSCSGGQSHAQ